MTPQIKKRKTLSKKDQSYEKERFRIIFEYSPIAIWEEDFSALSKLRNSLRNKNVDNIRKYLLAHPRVVAETFRKLKVLDVNQEALKLYGAKTKSELLNNLGKTIHKDVFNVLVDEFAALMSGDVTYNTEFKSRTIKGKIYDVAMHVSVPEIYRDSLKRVIVSFQDISVQKRHERHLKRLAQTDGLTKVLNYNAIRYRLEEEFLRASRYHLDLSCIMIDMDNFKKINDTHGHLIGDQVLKKTAKLIKDSFRGIDVIGRYGGDEFFVILPETSTENAKLVAARLTKIFADKVEKSKGKGKYTTLSIGIAGRSGKGINTAKNLIEKVDRALYQAKKKGRNCAVISK